MKSAILASLEITINAYDRDCFYSPRSTHPLSTVIYPQFLAGPLATHVKDYIPQPTMGLGMAMWPGQANKIQAEVWGPFVDSSFKDNWPSLLLEKEMWFAILDHEDQGPSLEIAA